MTDKNDLPIHEVHRLKAIEHFIMAERAMASEGEGQEPLYEQAIMNCHFCVEMIMKAAIYKEGGTPPTSGADGHNLLKIANTRIQGKKYLHSAIVSNRFIVPFWHKIVGAWSTDKRYEFMTLSELDYDDLFEAYRRFYQWIKTQFVE